MRCCRAEIEVGADVEEEPKRPGLFDVSREEFQIHLDLDERAEKRTRLIMVIGSIFSFLLYPVCALTAWQVFPIVGDVAGWILVSLIPFMLGATISFFGMTMAGYKRGVWEWGFLRPSRCLLYGVAPLLITVIVPMVFMILAMIMFGMWFLMSLGGLLAAEIVERSNARKL